MFWQSRGPDDADGLLDTGVASLPPQRDANHQLHQDSLNTKVTQQHALLTQFNQFSNF
jgi:hypothetical protein